MPSTRRAFLATVSAATVSLAGCSEAAGTGSTPTSTDGGTGSTPTSTGGGTATRTPTAESVRRSVGETIAVDGTDLAVENPRVRKMIVSRGPAHDWLRHGDGQFLLVELTGLEEPDGASRRDPDAFAPLAVAVDGTIRRPETVYRLADVPPHQSGADGTAAAAIPVPATDADSAAVVWRGGDRDAYWEVPAATRERLASQPAFAVRSHAVTATDEGVELDVTVANEGDRSGLWLAQVSIQSFSGRWFVGAEIPAGGRVERTFRPVEYGPETGEVTVQFRSTTQFTETVALPTPTA